MAGERMQKMLKVYRKRYGRASRAEKGRMLTELCAVTGYHRKYMIALLHGLDAASEKPGRRRRGATYCAAAIRVIGVIWKAAGYPCGERLKAMVPQWLPWANRHGGAVTPALEGQIRSISARQIDRRLAVQKRAQKRRLYGHTKPGTLLKHHIPVKTECWDVREPGFTEMDTVSHSGPSATGEFLHSLNMTDIHTGWVETRAVMGCGERGVVEALESIRRGLPFALRAVDSDNGSEFINYHLFRYCGLHRLQFTRGRPNKKNDNAHIEQKNWTHVRKIFGWDRYDTRPVLGAMNDLYEHELRLMMNLFQPSVKLVGKQRVGARVHRTYDAPQTPLDRLAAFYQTAGKPLPASVKQLLALRAGLDPFALADAIEHKLARIESLRQQTSALCHSDGSPRGASLPHAPQDTPHALALQ